MKEVHALPYQSVKYPTPRYDYPEDLKTPVYEQLYEHATGELPPKYDLHELLLKVAEGTKVTSSPLGQHVGKYLQDVHNTTYAYLLEFVVAALGPLEPKAVSGHVVYGTSFDQSLKLSEVFVTKVDSPYEVRLYSNRERIRVSNFVVFCFLLNQDQSLSGFINQTAYNRNW